MEEPTKSGLSRRTSRRWTKKAKRKGHTNQDTQKIVYVGINTIKKKSYRKTRIWTDQETRREPTIDRKKISIYHYCLKKKKYTIDLNFKGRCQRILKLRTLYSNRISRTSEKSKQHKNKNRTPKKTISNKTPKILTENNKTMIVGDKVRIEGNGQGRITGFTKHRVRIMMEDGKHILRKKEQITIQEDRKIYYAGDTESDESVCCGDFEEVCSRQPYCSKVTNYFYNEQRNPRRQTRVQRDDIVLIDPDFTTPEIEQIAWVLKNEGDDILVYNGGSQARTYKNERILKLRNSTILDGLIEDLKKEAIRNDIETPERLQDLRKLNKKLMGHKMSYHHTEIKPQPNTSAEKYEDGETDKVSREKNLDNPNIIAHKPPIRTYGSPNTKKTRFHLSFAIEAGKNIPEKVRQKIQDLMTTCQERFDKSTTIIPWEAQDRVTWPIIEEIEQIPKQLSQMKIYLSRLNPKEIVGTNYTGILLGHDRSADHLKKDIADWLGTSGVEIFILKEEHERMVTARGYRISHNHTDMASKANISLDKNKKPLSAARDGLRDRGKRK